MPPPGQSWASVIGSGADLCRPPQGRAGCCYTLCPPGQIRFPCPQGQIWPPKQTWAHVISPRGRFGLPGEDLGPPPPALGQTCPPPGQIRARVTSPRGRIGLLGGRFGPPPRQLCPPQGQPSACVITLIHLQPLLPPPRPAAAPLPLHAAMMDASVRPPHGVNHAVDDPHPDAIAGDAHGGAGGPLVGHGVITIDGGRVRVPVRGIIPSSHGIKKPPHHATPQTAPRNLKIG